MKGANMSNEYFPLQAAVMSEEALGDYIASNYFSKNTTIKCRLFWRSIHDVYRVISGDSIYYYKMYKQGFRRYTEIKSEIDILNHLIMSDIEVVRPIAQKDGTYIGKFKTVFGERYGVLYASVGRCGFGEVEETSQLNNSLGAYIASVHKALDGIDVDIDRWELNTKLFIDDSMAEIKRFSEIHSFDTEFLSDVAKRVKFKLSTLSTGKPEYGLCHGGIGPENIRFDENNQPILFDFDFCGNVWRAYDIGYAYPFRLGYDSKKFEMRERRKNDFLDGYSKIRTMSSCEIDSLPVFGLFRRIFNMGTLYVSILHNTWGDSLTIQQINGDIENIKKWLALNPVI